MRRLLPCLLLAAAMTMTLTAGGRQDLGRMDLPLLVSTPAPPIPVRADGQYKLVYELHLTNTAEKTVTLTRVEVRGPQAVPALDGEALAAAIRPTGVEPKDPRQIPAGGHVVVLMWVSLRAVPDALAHHIEGVVEGDRGALAVDPSPIAVRGTPVRLARPLRGDRWLAANGPSNDSHHRRSWLAAGGRPLVPQRFAIDFVRLDGDRVSTGDPAENRSYRGYGAEVLAVAPARVASVKADVPDNVPANRAPTGLRLDEMEGNLVILDLGNGRFAHYAHLQPGSVRVKPGDRVRTGQTLGLLGNSGNSNAPHLHFQVSTGPSVLLSDGLPFVFDSFVHDGRVRTAEIPLRDWIVDFR